MKKSELRTIIKEKIASRLYEMKDDSYYNKLVIDIEEGEYDNIGEDWSEEKWDEMEAKFGSYDNWDGVDILASITGLDKDKAYDIWHNREKNIADPEYFSLNENKNAMKKSELKKIIKNELLKEGFEGFNGVISLGATNTMKSLSETEEPDYGAAGSKDVGEAGEEDYEEFMDAVNDINESDFKVDSTYTHFAIDKSTGKIVNGWEYDSDTDRESIREYCKMDLEDMFPERKFSEFKILTTKSLQKQGIDPFSWDNWRKTTISESEEGNSKVLASKISDVIQSVDDSLSYIDLADAIASILKDEYGKHNFNPFIQRLTSQL